MSGVPQRLALRADAERAGSSAPGRRSGYRGHW
jgi:hypothetical protein